MLREEADIPQPTSLLTVPRAHGYVPTKVTNPGFKSEACTRQDVSMHNANAPNISMVLHGKKDF
jgi:hypothetical protein